MPHHNTIRRVFQNILDEAEFDSLLRGYPQQWVKGGKQLAMDGKRLRGARLADKEPADHVLSVHDVQAQCGMVQAVVEQK